MREESDAMAGDKVDVPYAVKTSDLPKRLASAAIMLGVAGAALWLGRGVLDTLIVVVALACLVEFVLLVVKATRNVPFRLAAILAGTLYIALAAFSLVSIHAVYVAAIVGLVICTDTAAYFTGRAIGGPKIAPRISPSKTWAGLVGGMVAAALWLMLAMFILSYSISGLTGPGPSFGDTLEQGHYALAALIGAGLAVTAQAGDFFESWLKRRAGVKDSSRLIPGHGGVFDRVDGLLPVAILAAWLMSLT